MIDHEGEGWRDWFRYFLCRVVGHDIGTDGDEWFCRRCGDVLPHGPKRWQP